MRTEQNKQTNQEPYTYYMCVRRIIVIMKEPSEG